MFLFLPSKTPLFSGATPESRGLTRWVLRSQARPCGTAFVPRRSERKTPAERKQLFDALRPEMD